MNWTKSSENVFKKCFFLKLQLKEKHIVDHQSFYEKELAFKELLKLATLIKKHVQSNEPISTLLTFRTNVGVAHKSSVVLDGNCNCYIEYQADQPRNPCGHKNSSPNPKITACYPIFWAYMEQFFAPPYMDGPFSLMFFLDRNQKIKMSKIIGISIFS